MSEELEKLRHKQYVAERKLTAAKHKEKRLQSELKRLTRSERTHRLCTRAGMLETFLKEPTVHMGAAVCALERKGIETNIGNLNRDIKAANRMMNAIRSTIQNLRNWIADIVEATKEAFAETEAQAKNTSPDLVILLRDYLNLRKRWRVN